MITIILIFLIAISLSMDAFFLSLAYGSLSLNKKIMYILSSVVGLYHFLMPIFGILFGELLQIKSNYIVSIIFFIIGINMILEVRKEKDIKPLSLFYMLLFGFSVSIDSFTIGIGLSKIMEFTFLCPIMFSLVSFIFTYIGLLLGKKINELIGNISVILGGITIIILGVYYII